MLKSKSAQWHVNTFEAETVTIAAQIPVSGSTFPALLTGPAYPFGSGCKGAFSLATGSNGVGDYVLTLSDAYPKCLFWDVKYESLNSKTDNIGVKLVSNNLGTFSAATSGSGTPVIGAQFEFLLTSGSTVVPPSSGSFINFFAVMGNSTLK